MAKGKQMKVEVNFIAKTKGLDKAFSRINKQRDYADAKMRLSNKGRITDMQTQERVSTELAASRMVQHRREVKHAKDMRGVMLGRNLSWMFFGMMIQKTMSGVLRSLTNTYKIATEGDSDLGKATTRMSASWEYLKFSIMNALDNPGFIKFLDFMTGAISAVGNFVAENEWAAYAIIGTFAALFTFGTGLMIFGQFALAWGSTVVWMAASNAGGGLAPFAAGGAARIGFTNFMKFISGLAIFWLVWEGIKGLTEGDFGTTIAAAIGLGAWGIAGKGIGIPFFLNFKLMEKFKITAAEGAAIGAIAGAIGGPLAMIAGAVVGGLLGWLSDLANKADESKISTDAAKDSQNLYNESQSNTNGILSTLTETVIPDNIEQMNNMKSNWESFRSQTLNNQIAVEDLGNSINDLPTEKHIHIYTHHHRVGDSSTD